MSFKILSKTVTIVVPLVNENNWPTLHEHTQIDDLLKKGWQIKTKSEPIVGPTSFAITYELFGVKTKEQEEQQLVDLSKMIVWNDKQQ